MGSLAWLACWDLSSSRRYSRIFSICSYFFRYSQSLWADIDAGAVGTVGSGACGRLHSSSPSAPGRRGRLLEPRRNTPGGACRCGGK